MAGHSKYANIKHRKNAQDAKRAKKFNKLARAIAVAVRTGGGDDPDFNPSLRTAISEAKSENLPKDRIKKAIETGLGIIGDEGQIEEIRYEGYGPGGAAVVVEAMTDNRNRAAAEIRTAFSKHSGSMGETGCVIYMFDHVGRTVLNKEVASDEEIFETAVELGAQNVISDDEKHIIYTSVDDFADILTAIEEKYDQPKASGLYWKATTEVSPSDDEIESLTTLYEVLDDLEDVQKVYTNADQDIAERARS